jgi:hypothetical protein
MAQRNRTEDLESSAAFQISQINRNVIDNSVGTHVDTVSFPPEGVVICGTQTGSKNSVASMSACQGREPLLTDCTN